MDFCTLVRLARRKEAIVSDANEIIFFLFSPTVHLQSVPLQICPSAEMLLGWCKFKKRISFRRVPWTLYFYIVDFYSVKYYEIRSFSLILVDIEYAPSVILVEDLGPAPWINILHFWCRLQIFLLKISLSIIFRNYNSIYSPVWGGSHITWQLLKKTSCVFKIALSDSFLLIQSNAE